MVQMKFNLDLVDASTFALYRVDGQQCSRLELHQTVQSIKQIVDKKNNSYDNIDTKLLFRSWIFLRSGLFDRCVFQGGEKHKKPTTELWLAFMEAVFMMMNKKYLLTEDESIMLGCLKMQAESGDFDPRIHSLDKICQRVADRFPSPVGETMTGFLAIARVRNDDTKPLELADRIRQIYARIAGKIT